jgi:NAD(P)-dependent dehydrogenase (short-subunit alcohol dehydrogenase family)
MTTLNISPSDLSALANKVAIITGGGSGIGLATALLFAQHGAHVVVADLSPPITPVPASTFAKCDVTVWADILSAFSVAVEKFGAIDILVANAGVGEIDGDIFRDEYDAAGQLKQPTYRTAEINLIGVMSCVKVAVSHFRKQGRGGQIVMTASTAGYMSEPGVPIYSAAKHGVVGFMRAVKRVCAKHDITINCVAPWMTDTRLIYPALRKTLAEANIPVQPTEAVALAMGYSVAKEGWTGKTIYVAAGTYTEIEEPILRLEEEWLGLENSRMFRLGQGLDYMTNTDVEKEHKGGFS